MASLDRATQQELLILLAPLMGSQEDRRALLSLALGANCSLLNRIDYGGPAEPFILKMIVALADFGKTEAGEPALGALLEVVRERVGLDRQTRIDALRPLLTGPPASLLTTTGHSLPPPLHLRIFLASPGDVADERVQALKVLEQLQYDPLLRGRVTVETVAWDKPGAGAPMLATLTPQAAIARGLAKPSECDIVVVILWSRIGTPLPNDWKKPDGRPYLSGTDWEYHDALQAAEQHGKPEILVYRRGEKRLLDPDEDGFEEKCRQWQQVKQFFAAFQEPDGSIKRGYNAYSIPEEFRSQLDLHLRELVRRRLDTHAASVVAESMQPVAVNEKFPLWEGSPFPGLRAFTPEDAPIFFGRGRETDALLCRLADPANRFIAVVGASGSGKSSLVAAGLLPWLKDKAVWTRFTPGGADGHPLRALAEALAERRNARSVDDLEKQCCADPDGLTELTAEILKDQPDTVEWLLFIDQFEELFTLVPERPEERRRSAFITWLAAITHTPRVRVVATLRADFYAACVAHGELTELLRSGSFPLAAPDLSTLYEMITGPEERAGLTFETGLAAQLLADTGTEPGNLALLAFALAELYKTKTDDGRLTMADYRSFGGVPGAIGQRAEAIFNTLKLDIQAKIGEVFRDLVDVDERGVATRRRALLSQVTHCEATRTLVQAFREARLLVTDESQAHEPVIEVAHEALFRSWPRLERWVQETADDHRLRRQITQLAAYWEAHNRLDEHRWPDNRVKEVVDMLEHLGLQAECFSALEQNFLGPLDCNRMLAELNNPETTHKQRAIIGVRLALLGDPRPGVGLRADGLPDIEWCEVPGGEVTLEENAGTFTVEPFRIAKYLVTYRQYRAFLDADDGYHNPEWWQGLWADRPPEKPGRQFQRYGNHPTENVAWLEAVPFCRWLSIRLGYEVRLPTEWEWQQAATGGDPANEYPWGPEWDGNRTNTYESELNRSTAVGMYPQGASPVGALDMSGNVWEWCLNEYDRPGNVTPAGDARRVVRGGSWFNAQTFARAAFRFNYAPGNRFNLIGFRLACSSPI